MFKAGKIKFVAPYDPVNEPGILRIELLDERGEPVGELDIEADAITRDEERRAIAIFEHHVDNAPRKVEYLKKFDNDARVAGELREDWDDWYLRRRGDQAHYGGIDPAKVRQFNMCR